MPSPKVDPVVLSDEERSVLAGWARRRKTSQALALRARIVLRSADGGTIGDDQIEAVITKTLESTPGEDTHWSTRSMATSTGMSQSAVSRIWRAFGLKPHAIETWK